MKRIGVLLLSLATAASACSSDAVAPAQTVLQLNGRLERGSTVDLVELRGSANIPIDSANIVMEPAGIATLVSGSRIRLDQVGSITVRVATASGSLETHAFVAQPPTVWFHMRSGSNRDIYSISLDGGDLLRITTDAADDHDPAVGGQKLVFVSDRAGAGDLYASNLYGAGAASIIASPSVESAPALSRDGSSLAFIRTTSGIPRVWTAQSDGSNAAQAAIGATFEGGIEADPSWCNSDRVAFLSTNLGNADLFLLKLPSTVMPIAVSGDPEVEPACNGDGTRIAFTSGITGGNSHIFIADLATLAVTQLTTGDGNEGSPTWLADGRIVFLRFTNAGADLMWLDPSSPSVTHLIPTPSPSVGAPTTLR